MCSLLQMNKVAIPSMILLPFNACTSSTLYPLLCVLHGSFFPLLSYLEFSCLSYSWAALHGVSTNTSTFTDYLTSLYWAATTMTSTGYGDITPHSGSERTFSIVAMVTGLLIFGYTLGLIAATLTNSASIRYGYTSATQCTAHETDL